MKKFVITGIAAGNIANLPSFYIESDGSNIYVTGQNGVGKSTLMKTIWWTLAGSTADGEKLIPIVGDGLPYAEVEIFDGETKTLFRKEIVQYMVRGKIARTADCFLNGLPVALKDFQEFFNAYIPVDGLQILTGLGNFFKLKPAEQRRILTENFSSTNDAELAAEVGLDTNGLTVEMYADALKDKVRRIKKEVASIPAVIAELEKQLVEVVDDRGTLDFEKLALEMELKEMLHKMALSDEIRSGITELQRQAGQATQDYWQRRKEYDALKDKIAAFEDEIAKLREQYEMPPENCPVCGQPVNNEHIEKMREKIVEDAKKISVKIAEYRAKLIEIAECGKTARQEMDAANEKLEALDFDSTEYDLASKRRNDIQREISARDKRIAKIETQLELNAKNARRITELKAREKDLGAKLSEYEGQLALCDKFTRTKVNLVTDDINSKFQYVKFKMFETLKSGEVKSTCIATLNGVPCDNLSKGEKLKAALDVHNIFQRHYGVMLPLIIDDAESYTSNSLIEVENQQILLKAVEGQAELKIDCDYSGKKIA